MSYEVLARKWRPASFATMVGQEHVLRALIHALEADRLHHAYLFTGTRGVGKTTVARILARCLNCEKGVTAEPCGTCSSCVEIAEGRFVDLIEVDAASRTKVEDTRELLENVQYAPIRGRYKVYLIDEVHMLSTASFNALLKTLEEPPPHVKFLLATTDPKKLPVTVLSRCLQFHLKNLTPERIVGHLQHVLGEEGVSFDDGALRAIARAADGSMRDALSLTDQAVAHGGGSLAAEEVALMLGTIDQDALQRILVALAAQDGPGLLACVDDLMEHAADFAQVLRDLMSALHQVAVVQAIPEAAPMADPDALAGAVADAAARLLPEDVQLYYQIALTGLRDLAFAPDPRTGFEMTLLRMLAFRPAQPGGAPRRDGAPEGDTRGAVGASPGGQESASAPTSASAAAPASAPAPGSAWHVQDAPEAAAPSSGHGGIAGADASRAGAASAEKHGAQAEKHPAEAENRAADAEHRAAQAENHAAPAAQHAAQLRTDRGANAVPREAQQPIEAAPGSAAHTRAPASAAGAAASRAEESSDVRAPVADARAGSASGVDGEARSAARPAATITALRTVVPDAPEQPVETAGAAADADPSGDAVPVRFEHPADWHEVLPRLALAGLTGELAAHCLPKTIGAGTVELMLDPRAESLLADVHVMRLQTGLETLFGGTWRVRIEAGMPAGETPARRMERERDARQQRAEQLIADDPLVRALIATFDASVVPGSIRPLH